MTFSIKIPFHSLTVMNQCLSAPVFFVNEHMLNAGMENIQSSSTTFMDTTPGMPPLNITALIAGEAEGS
jgi:hypothetical protein